MIINEKHDLVTSVKSGCKINVRKIMMMDSAGEMEQKMRYLKLKIFEKFDYNLRVLLNKL